MSRTTDAIDKTALEKRSRGRSQTLLYNEVRTHQGRWCYGKTPMQTFLDSLPMAREKLIDQQSQPVAVAC